MFGVGGGGLESKSFNLCYTSYTLLVCAIIYFTKTHLLYSCYTLKANKLRLLARTFIKSSGCVQQAAAHEAIPPKYQREMRVSVMTESRFIP